MVLDLPFVVYLASMEVLIHKSMKDIRLMVKHLPQVLQAPSLDCLERRREWTSREGEP